MKRFLAFLLFLPLFTIAMDKSWIGTYVENEKRIKEEQEKQNRTDAVIELLRSFDELSKDPNKEIFYKQPLLDQIKPLLQSGIDFDKEVKIITEPWIGAKHQRTNILGLAAHQNLTEVVNLSLAQGANPNPKPPFDTTALKQAISNNNEPMIQALLKNNAHVNIIILQPIARWYNGKNMRTDTLLNWAFIAHKPLKIIQLLLDHGANPNFTNEDKETALHIAAESSETPDGVQLLLEKGANPLLIDSRGRTPLFLAAKHHHPEIARLLINAAKKRLILDPIQAVAREKGSYLNLLPGDVQRLTTSHLNPDSYINKPDVDGNTPLIAALRYVAALSDVGFHAVQAPVKTIQLLLENGANVSIKNQEGKTALDFAREKGNQEIIKLLSDAAVQQ